MVKKFTLCKALENGDANPVRLNENPEIICSETKCFLGFKDRKTISIGNNKEYICPIGNQLQYYPEIPQENYNKI